MPTTLRKPSLLLAVYLSVAASVAINTAIAQNKSAPKAHQPAASKAETTQADAADQNNSDIPDDELEAAAVTLDVSHSSPLIQKLYQATRETKEQDILARLTEAKKLLGDGAGVH